MSDWQKLIKKYNDNFENVVAEDAIAKKKKQLVGRYVSELFADGRAYYRIVKENKKTVKMEVITDIGDDWVIPYWGPNPTIWKSYAIDSIKGRDALEKIFSH